MIVHDASRRPPLGEWGGRRVALVCAMWLLGAPVLAALGLVLGGAVLAGSPGHREVSVTVNLTSWGTGIVLLGPPALLVAVWLWRRDLAARRRERPRSTDVGDAQ